MQKKKRLEMTIYYANPHINKPLSDNEIGVIREELYREELFSSIMDDNIEQDDLLAAVVSDVTSRTLQVFDIRCAAHTVQLMVKDAFKELTLDLLLKVAQSVAKDLRKRKFINAAREEGITYNFVRLCCKTRWDSEYFMVSGKWCKTIEA